MLDLSLSQWYFIF